LAGCVGRPLQLYVCRRADETGVADDVLAAAVGYELHVVPRADRGGVLVRVRIRQPRYEGLRFETGARRPGGCGNGLERPGVAGSRQRQAATRKDLARARIDV